MLEGHLKKRKLENLVQFTPCLLVKIYVLIEIEDVCDGEEINEGIPTCMENVNRWYFFFSSDFKMLHNYGLSNTAFS